MCDYVLTDEELKELEDLPPIHPGEILREDYLSPLGMSTERLALGLGLPKSVVQRILNGDGDITANIALRLSRFFKASPEFWMGIQMRYDLDIEKRRESKEIDTLRPFQAA